MKKEGSVSEIGAAVRLVVEETLNDGRGYFKAAIKKSGLVQTGALYDSVELELKSIKNDLLGENWEFRFNKYWRYKDMKQLRYSQWLNGDAILEWIDKVGLDKFAYVPGYYKSTSQVPTAIAKRRIYWAILNWHRAVPIVNNSGKIRLYNKTKMNMMNVLRHRVLDTVTQRVPLFLKEKLEEV